MSRETRTFDRKRDPLTCWYCGLSHEKVEAGGVYHCPNPLCTGPGAAMFRAKLSSFAEGKDGRHTVDNAEMIAYGKAFADALKFRDPPLYEHILSCVQNWSEDRPEARPPQ